MITPAELEFHLPIASTGGVDVYARIGNIWTAFEPLTAQLNLPYIGYRKLWLKNANANKQLINTRIELVEASNLYDSISIAKEKVGSALPQDSFDINVRDGSGPDTFVLDQILLGNINVGEFAPFWIRRFIYCSDRLEQLFAVKLKVIGYYEP